MSWTVKCVDRLWSCFESQPVLSDVGSFWTRRARGKEVWRYQSHFCCARTAGAKLRISVGLIPKVIFG